MKKKNTINIPEVVVYKADKRLKKLGPNNKSSNFIISINPENKYATLSEKELATKIHNSKKRKIHYINVNVWAFKSNVPVKMKFNVYNVGKDGKPAESILKKDIIVYATKESIVDKILKVNVQSENIIITGDCFVSLQVLNSFEGYIFISSGLFKGALYRTDDQWKKIPMMTPSINIDVK